MVNSENNQVRTALVFGATGGFGIEMCEALLRQSWRVRAVSRSTHASGAGTQTPHAGGIEWVTGTLDNPENLQEAAAAVDVIVHAANVPYHKWDPLMINYTRNIIELAQANNAHLLFVGNIYNAGLPADGLITEHTVDAPINDKGEIRSQLERMIFDAAEQGLRATVMRFGDFFGPNVQTSNWFNECTKAVSKRRLNSATPNNVPHTWAYLPDAAKAAEQVLSRRLTDASLPAHMVLPFAGHVFSFEDLKQTLETLSGHSIKMGSLPWGLYKVLSFVMPVMRDILAMRYLWDHDIRMDGRALEALLGHAPHHTNLADAVHASVPKL